MEYFMQFLNIVSTVITVVSLIFYIYLFVLWVRGIAPVLYRIGKGLSQKKVAILAKGDNLKSMDSLLKGSKLFRKKNIVGISTISDLDNTDGKDIFLVYWSDWKDDITSILSKVKHQTALVIYDPERSIPPDQWTELSKKINASVTNFRGRLLNDVVTSIITISQQ